MPAPIPTSLTRDRSGLEILISSSEVGAGRGDARAEGRDASSSTSILVGVPGRMGVGDARIGAAGGSGVRAGSPRAGLDAGILGSPRSCGTPRPPLPIMDILGAKLRRRGGLAGAAASFGVAFSWAGSELSKVNAAFFLCGSPAPLSASDSSRGRLGVGGADNARWGVSIVRGVPNGTGVTARTGVPETFNPSTTEADDVRRGVPPLGRANWNGPGALCGLQTAGGARTGELVISNVRGGLTLGEGAGRAADAARLRSIGSVAGGGGFGEEGVMSNEKVGAGLAVGFGEEGTSNEKGVGVASGVDGAGGSSANVGTLRGMVVLGGFVLLLLDSG